MIMIPVPLIMAATTPESKPSEAKSTDRWEKPGFAKAPIKRLTQAIRAQVRGGRPKDLPWLSGWPSFSSGTPP